LYNLGNLGPAPDYTLHENYDFFYGLEAELDALTETHNYIPGSKDDVNFFGYMQGQFHWGTKLITYFRHPGDDDRCLKGAKNILGR